MPKHGSRRSSSGVQPLKSVTPTSSSALEYGYIFPSKLGVISNVLQTMIHELRAEYFVKDNVLAMLNTLFPPSARGIPDRIPPKVLHLFRNTFYGHLVSVQAHGPDVMH